MNPTESALPNGQITLTEVNQLGKIRFHQPLLIEWYSDETQTDLVHVGYETPYGTIWDRFTLDPARNMHARDRHSPAEIVRATAEYDLAHAFFHTNVDPNYALLHWALWGALRNSVTCTEVEEISN